MKFNNYLLDIALPDVEISKTLCKSPSISVHGVNEILLEIFNEIKEEIPEKTLQYVASELGNDYTSVHCWLMGYNPVPILKAYNIFEIWKAKCGKSQQEFEDKWNYLFESSTGYSSRARHKVRFPKRLSNNLAYVIGFLLADGYIKNIDKLVQRKKYPEYTITFNDKSEEFLKEIEKIVVSEFSVKCNLHYAKDEKGSWYCLRCTSKPVHRFFTEVLGLPSGYKQGKVCVPEIIKQASEVHQKAFISGFCDGEGCVGISTKNPYFEVVQVSYTENPPEILIWISQKLNEFGIRISAPQKGTSFWRLRTGSQKVINSYYTIISSRHVDKIPKFEKVRRLSDGKRDWGDDRA